jgi:hypothetical protein
LKILKKRFKIPFLVSAGIAAKTAAATSIPGTEPVALVDVEFEGIAIGLMPGVLTLIVKLSLLVVKVTLSATCFFGRPGFAPALDFFLAGAFFAATFFTGALDFFAATFLAGTAFFFAAIFFSIFVMPYILGVDYISTTFVSVMQVFSD